jgi:hypothetical protein
MLVGLVLALAAPAASAVTVNTAGSVCNPISPSDVDNALYTNGQVGPGGLGALFLDCAVPRAAGGIQMTVHVDFLHSGTQTSTCTIYVYDRDGNPQTGIFVSKTGSGWQRASATFTAAQNPAWGYTTAMCALNNTNTSIIGVTAAY